MTAPLNPGWYPDPADPSRNLYWDGRVWHRNGAPPPTPALIAPPPPKKRRGLWIGLVAVIGLFAVLGQCDNAKQEMNTESTTTTTMPSATSGAAAPPPSTTSPASQYTLIGQRKRFDGQPIDYVLIDPVNLTNDGFKETVKEVLQRLAANKGDANFSAWIYDNRDVAQMSYADQVTPPVSDTPEEIRAKAKQREPHLVATYSGGNPNAGMMFGIMWFPGATTDSAPPDIAQWVGNEEFKP